MASENPKNFSPRKQELLHQLSELYFAGRPPGPSAYISALYEESEEFLEKFLNKEKKEDHIEKSFKVSNTIPDFIKLTSTHKDQGPIRLRASKISSYVLVVYSSAKPERQPETLVVCDDVNYYVTESPERIDDILIRGVDFPPRKD